MPPQTVLPMLHRFLGIGLVILAAVFLVLRSRGIPAPLTDGEATVTLAYVMSGLGLAMMAFALLVSRKRVPQRLPAQTEPSYLATPEVAAAVMQVWFLLEGAAIVAAVGYLLTAQPVAALTGAILIGVFWLYGPASLSRAA